MMDVQKKKRSPNFTQQEKHLLINIIANRYTEIIENKKTNQVSVSEKLTTWKKIENEFNASSSSSNFRTWQNLKLFYENQKKEIRKKKAEEKSERFKTGGGPPATSVINSKDPDEVLASIINDKTISGLSNPFDSDNLIEDGVAYDPHVISDLTFEISNEAIEKEEDLISRIGRENNTMGMVIPYHQENPITENVTRSSPVPNIPQLSTPGKKPFYQRRRPMKTIQTLTSSKFAEKYDYLMDKRLLLVEKQIASIDSDIRMKSEKHKLEIELLKVQIKNNST